ncbi:MAG: carbohydrate ABC transporter permease [Alphaproteobacteria bacterium]|nr:carbohydrate ABC transporter permease [Alphaproteobacteria bacterium]
MTSAARSWRWTAAAFVTTALVLFPFYWMVTTALRKESSVFAYPPNLLPTDLSPGLLLAVLWKTDVVRWLLNTAFIAGTATFIVLPIAAISAYALARQASRVVSLTALLIVVTQMMPPALLLVPYFVMFRELGLLDTYTALIIANVAWAAPVSAWLMKSAFQSVPVDLESAALVDGCSRMGAFFRISVPLALPGIAATTVFAFISAWDEYLFARTFVSNSAYWVVSVGLGSFTGDYSTSWQQIMAVATLSTLPPAILFLFVQRAFVDGIASGGLKG